MDRKQLEEQLAHTLSEGEMTAEDPEEAATRKLPPKTEIRIQMTNDPIRRGTKQYRAMAEEIDDRYDRFMARDQPEGSCRQLEESSKLDSDKG